MCGKKTSAAFKQLEVSKSIKNEVNKVEITKNLLHCKKKFRNYKEAYKKKT